ncbi:MAG: UvrD-helicase domain-containing protein [Candidatus Kryptoniota bacterium]
MAELTDQQKKSLVLDKHISVMANAGSGKTRVLVERYVEAIKGGVTVEEILCLTFTEKAALELRQKINERINSEVGANHDSPLLSLLRKARANMLEANISTIHSFCSQVLREFPIEAGVDANFKVLEDFDAAILKEEACDKAVREALAEERASHGKFHDFLVRVGYKRTLQLLNDFLDNREKIEHVNVTGHALLMNENIVREHWKNLSEAVLKVLRENLKLKKGNLEVSELNNALKSDSSNLKDILGQLKTLLNGILTNDGTPRKKEVEKIVDGETFSSETALNFLRTALEPLKQFSPDSLSPVKYFALLEVLLGLYEKAADDYSRKKFSMGALDFDDLQIRTMRLIRETGNVRAALTSRFKHIMVDEFQDTNFLQYDIFMRLLDNFAGDARLFVVGDPKQSIYRFRNAQVEVSLKTEKDLSERSDGAALPLVESFRMNADLGLFVNEIFSKVMTQDRVSDVVGFSSINRTEYNSLVPRRQKGIDPAIEIFCAGGTSTFDRAAQNKNSNENPVDASENEASAGELQAIFAGSRIRKMIDDGETINDVKANEQSRKIKYGDIAILLRSRAKLALLEQALSEMGVPYVVTSGIGFYSAQEIFDLTNYLTFLLDNNSDIALLTALRSPFFGISENELYQTSMCKGETLFEKFRRLAQSEKVSNEVKYAVSVLDDEIQLAHRLTIPQLVNRILERTGWLGAYKLSPTGGQRIANMRKLLNIAREFEERGFNNLFDFVERIKNLKDAREGQAPAEETVDAVKIMTVHAAKGLEFPVVVVPFCDATTNRRQTLIINDQIGILPFISNEVPPELALYQKFEAESEQAEIARLFYVACTRAMDKLILTTSARNSKSINSFNEILNNTFDFSAVPSSGYYEYPGGKVRVFNEVPVTHHEVEDPVGGKAKPIMKPKEEITVGKIFLDPIPADIDGEIYSATLLQTFKLCPTKYFLKYRLGMPAPDSAERIVFNEFAEYDDSILSTVRGELIHSVLQSLIADGRTGDTFINEIAERVVSSRFGKSLRHEQAKELSAQIVENAKNAIATLHKIIPNFALNKIYSEQTITRKFRNDFLTGTLDLLVENERGFHIFDYKTNRLDKGTDKIYSDYEIQMKLYASLCSRLQPEQDAFDVTIIFTREAGKYLTKKYSRKELEDFENELEATLREIKMIEPVGGIYPSVDSDSLPTWTSHCPECEYFVGERKNECLLKGK